jgi:uncharacterized spore protein YtfJ
MTEIKNVAAKIAAELEVIPSEQNLRMLSTAISDVLERIRLIDNQNKRNAEHAKQTKEERFQKGYL